MGSFERLSLLEHLEGPAHVCEAEHLMSHCNVFRNCLSLKCFQDLFAFAVWLRGWVVARSHEPVEQARANEDRARCAAMLVLWPRAAHKRRRPGRPSYQETWEDRLYRAIHHGTVPGDMTSGVMPKWWRPHAPEKEEPNESPSKRVKIHHCAEVKDWFLDLVAIQRERLGWNTSRHFAMRSSKSQRSRKTCKIEQLNPKSWKIESSSCQCSMTSNGQREEIQNSMFQMPNK